MEAFDLQGLLGLEPELLCSLWCPGLLPSLRSVDAEVISPRIACWGTLPS